MKKLVLLAALAVSQASAALLTIQMNTAALAGFATPLTLDFQFIDGELIGNNNNMVTISDFNLGGGILVGSPTLFGGASGDLNTVVTFQDSVPVSGFQQAFIPGSSLWFRILLTDNPEPTFPDSFTFAILDSTLTPISTTSFFDVFVQIDIPALVPGNSQSFGDPTTGIPGPVITAIPEPSTWMLAAPLALLVFRRRR
ncbi:MAG: NF038129 family PEP-CTERM protein [Bryobacteraceae bacterium]|nr:NF038129 family PEP-CTERM protein [Bryobacteraceae bacterium]